MKFKFIFILSLLVAKSYAQSIKISGMVVDGISKKELAGATIEIGHSKVISNKKGVFDIAVSKDVLEQGLKASYIGYTTTTVKNITPNKFLLIELTETSNNLPEIVLSNKGLLIIKKAIEAIEKNYPSKPYYNYCTQWITSVVNDEDFLMYDTAQLKVYVPSYADYNDPIQMQLLSNKRKITQKDSTKHYRDHKGYSYAISSVDFVHNRNLIANTKKIDHYAFSLKGVINYKDRRMYAIDFFRKKNRAGYEGTVLIDSSTYAFACVSYMANEKLKSNKSFLDGYKDFFQFIRYEYDFKNGGWFFSEFRAEQHERLFDFALMKTNFYSVAISAISTQVDTTNASPIDKADRIQRTDNFKKVNKLDPEL